MRVSLEQKLLQYINKNEVWSWGVVRSLNRLSYMKDKNEVIAEEIRQRNGIKR